MKWRNCMVLRNWNILVSVIHHLFQQSSQPSLKYNYCISDGIVNKPLGNNWFKNFSCTCSCNGASINHVGSCGGGSSTKRPLYYISKGAPKGRDGRDSSLPVLKLVGIGRDEMVVILENPRWFLWIQYEFSIIWKWF